MGSAVQEWLQQVPESPFLTEVLTLCCCGIHDWDEEETVMHRTSKLYSYIFVLKGEDEILVCQECGGKGLNFKGYFKG